jgi:hypothetical protein
MRRVMKARGLRVLLSNAFSVGPGKAVDNLAVERKRRYPMSRPRLDLRVSRRRESFQMASASKTEMLENLRGMLRDVLRLRTEGVAYAKLSRAHGYLDGYMRVLLEKGLFSQKELLALISEERQFQDGPATGIVTEDTRLARSELPSEAAPRANRARAA